MSREMIDAPRRIDRPEPGYFKLRLVRRGPWVPAKIIFDGEQELWGAVIRGQPAGAPHRDPFRAAGVSRVWEGGRRIDADEYAWLLEVLRHAASHPDHPAADPMRPIDIHRAPPVY